MRVVVVSALFPGEGTGGTERVALDQARALRAAGHEVRVVTGRPVEHAGAAPLRETSDGLEVVRLAQDPAEAGAPLLRRPRTLRALLREVGTPDAVHVQHLWSLELGLVRALAPVAPVLLALHDLSALCPRHFRTPPDEALTCPTAGELRERRLRACVRCVADLAGGAPESEREVWLRAHLDAWQAEVDAAARVLVPSRTHLVRLADGLRLSGQARILAPGPGADVPAGRAATFRGDGPLRVLHPGRRSVEKGTLDLARALAELPAGRVELVAPGGAEPGFDDLLRTVAPDLALELHGPYDLEALARLAATCHLAALPSRLPESYSLVLDECLALGLPVATSAGEAARERFGAGPLLELPPADPAAWTEALGHLLDHPHELAELRECVPAREDLPADAGARLEALLREVVHERSSSPAA